MKRWPLVTLGLALYGAGLLATAPATLLDPALSRHSGGRLRLVEAAGTVWSGSGLIELRDRQGRSATAKRLRWKIDPRSLWRGRIDLLGELVAEPASAPFPVSLGWSGVSAGRIELQVPAGVLGIAIPQVGVLGLTGQLAVRITHFSLQHQQLDGQATLLWRDAGSSFSKVAPLGTYELQLDSVGGVGKALLRTVAGPLQLDGTGRWSAGSVPDLALTAQVAPPQQAQLFPLLRLIGVERSAGVFELQLR